MERAELPLSTLHDDSHEQDDALARFRSENQSEEIVESLIGDLSEERLNLKDWLDVVVADEQVKALLVRWGSRDTERFLSRCDDAFQNVPRLRIAIMVVVLDLILKSPYEAGAPGSATLMYKIASMGIFNSVIMSLLLDTGNHLFPLCLRFIISLIPYAPQLVTPKIPQLMVSLGRAVCWRDRPFIDAGCPAQAAVTKTPSPRSSWRVATSAMEAIVVPPPSLQPEKIVQLWVIVTYGAWPSNVLAFIRDPASYLSGKDLKSVYDVEWEDVWSEGLLAARAGPLLRDFSLHPDLIYYNSTRELADEKRWEKLDPPEIVSRAHLVAHSDKSSEPVLQDLDSSSIVTNLSQLQRENQLLRIEAGYAARQRQQYLYHLGRLHRHSMRFTVDEAEVHSFANRMKEQKTIIDGLTSELTQQRREASQAQQKHSKWQEQLREKLATFREEKRQWQGEASLIRADLSEAKATTQRQKDELAQVKNERFKLQNQLTEVASKIQHIGDYEIRMKQLTEAQRLWDSDVEKLQDAAREAQSWKARCYQLEQLLRARSKPEVPTITHIIESCPPKPQKVEPILDHYMASAQAANLRAEKLEKENLQLRERLDQLQRPRSEDGGDRTFIWG